METPFWGRKCGDSTVDMPPCLSKLGPLDAVEIFWVCFLVEVPTIGHYLIDMEKYFSDAYDALFLKKQRCDIAMATPFPNEELCGHKICQYYAS